MASASCQTSLTAYMSIHQILAAAQLPVQEGRGGQRADSVLVEHGQTRRVCRGSVQSGR